MKHLVIALFTGLMLSGCGNSPEQLSLTDALIAKLKDDPDLKDYKLDPAEIASCVEKGIEDSMPGFTGDPRRKDFFAAYTAFVQVRTASDAEQAVQKYKDLFGDIKEARAAANGITDTVMSCMGESVEKHAGASE